MEAKRDWGYAKEYVEGMWMMLQQDTPDDYVLATGKVHSVREFLEFCLKHAGISYRREGQGQDEHYVDTKTGKVIVTTDPHYYRPAEVDYLCGNPAKAKRVLGWEAKTDVDTLALLMLQEDCKALGVALPG
jgi:GDPmannose 4,6-dehydratase